MNHADRRAFLLILVVGLAVNLLAIVLSLIFLVTNSP
ncbi:hypothetical protein MAUB1S_08181 [Mycolicibacterium aubagnense]